MLQNDFLNLIANGSQSALEFDGSKTSRIPPTLDEALDITLHSTDETKQATQTELSLFATSTTPPSFTQTLPNTTPGSLHRLNTRLPKDVSKRIIAASKTRGFSVTTAVQYALILAAQSYLAPADSRLLCFNAYNIHGRTLAPWNGTQGATGLYHIDRLWTIDLTANRDYSSIAASLTSHYQRDMKPLLGILTSYIQDFGVFF